MSHACGTGALLSDEQVSLILLLKINQLALGYSGVRTELLHALCSLYNHQIFPCIPSRGSVGASGDLAPLAHLALPLLGEGQLRVHGKQVLHAKNLDYPWPEDSTVFDSELDACYKPENQLLFKLPYYYLPCSSAYAKEAKGIHLAIKEELATMKDGLSYYKLFVHPASQEFYAFLSQQGCQFVAAAESEYYASTLSSYRSLLAWRLSDNKAINPFIVKLSVDKIIFKNLRINTLEQLQNCMVVQKIFDELAPDCLDKAHFTPFPEVAILIPEKTAFKNSEKILGGQIKFFWFFKTYLIDYYLHFVEELNFKKGIIPFMPHAQNLLLETDEDLVPTGRFVLRDFTDISFDFHFAFAGDLDLTIQADLPSKALQYNENAGAYLAQALYGYRELLFKLVVSQLLKYDPQFSNIVLTIHHHCLLDTVNKPCYHQYADVKIRKTFDGKQKKELHEY